MSFRRYWLARAKESFGKGRVLAEAAIVLLLFLGGPIMSAAGLPHSLPFWWALAGGFLAILLIETCLISPANHAARLTRERDHAQDELVRIRDYQIARRERARQTCLEHCVDFYTNTKPALMIGALWHAGGHKLATNEDLVWVCRQLEQRGHGHPFANSSIPQENWLEFLRDAKLAGLDLARDAATAQHAFQEWHRTRRLTPRSSP